MYQSVEQWVRENGLPASMSAVDEVARQLGAAEILGFGEAMHGAEEFLILRNQIFSRLVEAHGFSAIAVESSFPRGRLVNDFVCGGDGTFEDVIERGFSHGFGKLAANRALVEWMRAYNAKMGRAAVSFYGFDSPTEYGPSDSPRQLLHFVLGYLAKMQWPGVAMRKARVDELIGDDAAWENPAAAMDASKAVGGSAAAGALRLETEELIAELSLCRPDFVERGGEERYLEATHYARFARQMLNYHAGLARNEPGRLAELLGLRDVMMAENLVYIAQREKPRGKVLAFAHNGHLKRGKMQWQLGAEVHAWWPAGAQLDVMIGERYQVIGTAVGVSAAHGAGEPEAGSLEAALRGRLVRTFRGEKLSKETLAGIIKRSGGRNGSYFPLSAESLREYDWIWGMDVA